MGCCGRPPNKKTSSDEAGYYARHAYLSSSQQTRQASLSVSNCVKCDAFTAGAPCKVCGNPKPKSQQEG